MNKRLEGQMDLINSLKEENKNLQQRIEVLEKDSAIAFKEIEETQRIAHSTDQYQRRNNIEISGIPLECDEDLKEVVIGLCNSILKEPGKPTDDTDCDIGDYDIEACHRLKSVNKDGIQNTIVRFVNRNVCDVLHDNKKRIKDVKMEQLGDTVKNIYINENLCRYYNDIGAKCRRLKKKGKILDTWTFKGLVKIKLNDNSIKVIIHHNDLERLFPNFVYFN